MTNQSNKTTINTVVRDGVKHSLWKTSGENSWRGHTAMIMFVNHANRPIENGNIAGDFEWRRTHEAPFSAKDAKALAQKRLSVAGLTVKSVRYSRKAGCKSCPCSPGYSVQLMDAVYTGQQATFWMDEETS